MDGEIDFISPDRLVKKLAMMGAVAEMTSWMGVSVRIVAFCFCCEMERLNGWWRLRLYHYHYHSNYEDSMESGLGHRFNRSS